MGICDAFIVADRANWTANSLRRVCNGEKKEKDCRRQGELPRILISQLQQYLICVYSCSFCMFKAFPAK